MLASVRHEFLLQELERHRTIRVSDMAKACGVTEKTIREDLALLEERGLLVRVHGGARLPDPDRALLPVQTRRKLHLERKRQIAAKAVAHIEANDTIILDSGSTILELARLLPDMPLTVITNDVPIMQELMKRTHIHLYVPGGSRAPGSTSLLGDDAETRLRQFRVQKAFIGATCVHPEHGLSLISHAEVTMKQTIIRQADQVFLLADRTKWNKIGLFPFASLDEIDVVITDEDDVGS